MEEKYINKTEYNKNEYKKFLKMHKDNFGIKEDIYTIMYIIIFISFIIVSIIGKVYYISLLVLLIFLIFIFYRILFQRKVVQNELKSKKVKEGYINTYKFYNLFFYIKNKEINTRVWYFKIYRVVESDTYFYIYLTSRKAFVVSKHGFVKGSSKEFAKFLKKRAFFKYKKTHS